jgi:transposase InsO family protein
VILRLFSRRIVGLAMSNRITRPLVREALHQTRDGRPAASAKRAQ